MSKKSIWLIILILSIICVFAVALIGSNPFPEAITQATYIKFTSEEFVLGDNEKIYYYLPFVNDNESVAVDLMSFVDLDPEATNGKESLKFTIVYDNPDDMDKLQLVSGGALAGRLTISGQTTAIITVSTTDGSRLSAQLYIRNYPKPPDEEHGGGPFD